MVSTLSHGSCSLLQNNCGHFISICSPLGGMDLRYIYFSVFLFLLLVWSVFGRGFFVLLAWMPDYFHEAMNVDIEEVCITAKIQFV